MREMLKEAYAVYAQGNIAKHVANVEVYLNNPAGIGEHPDIMEAIETEMEQIAKYDDMLEMVEKYFSE